MPWVEDEHVFVYEAIKNGERKERKRERKKRIRFNGVPHCGNITCILRY